MIVTSIIPFWPSLVALLTAVAVVICCKKKKPYEVVNNDAVAAWVARLEAAEARRSVKPNPPFQHSPLSRPATEFALSLLRAASGAGEQYVVSPFALGRGLAIIHDGAGGETQAELTQLLGGGTLSPSEVSTLYSSLSLALADKDADVVAKVASMFFLDQGVSLNSDYQSHVKKAYGAGAENLDFKDGEGSARHVNSFVRESTGGMIPRIVSAEAFKRDAGAVLINAVYFMGAWMIPFDKELTQTKPFNGSAGVREEHFMRHRDGLFTSYSISEELTVVLLGYKDTSYSLALLMPSGDFPKWKNELTTETLDEVIKATKSGSIKLELPKFKIEWATDCKDALSKCGVKSIFEGTADLSGISNEKFNVGRVMQKAMIEVDEEGTVAAAAEDYVYELGPRPAVPTVTFDHPFLFSIVKDDSILFIGVYC